MKYPFRLPGQALFTTCCFHAFVAPRGRVCRRPSAPAVIFRSAVFAVLLFCCTPALARDGRWCRGELHAHSSRSDGDSPVAFVIAEAERLGFDFFALTDHDTSQGGTPGHWSDPAYSSEKMVLLYGMEWTNAQGHANAWAAAPFDYQPLWAANNNSDPAAAALAMHEQGGLFSLNHPAQILGHPWLYPIPSEADCIEVWNSMFVLPSTSRGAVNLWDRMLRQGRRMTAVGGSDKHDYQGWRSYFFTLGMPTTWVWAEERSAGAILAGIKNGHVSISCSADSPRLELSADADGDGIFESIMGDTAPAVWGSVSMNLSVLPTGDQAPVQGSAREVIPHGARDIILQQAGGAGDKCPVYYLACVYKNGAPSGTWLVRGCSSVDFKVFVRPGDYVRAELKGLPDIPVPLRLLYGYMVALTNPIYIGSR